MSWHIYGTIRIHTKLTNHFSWFPRDTSHTHAAAVLIILSALLVRRVELFNRRSRKAHFAMDGLHKRTSDCMHCMAKILFSLYTSSRLWRNGRAEERYPIRRVSVLPLQVVERRLGLSWLSWLSSLESGVFVGNCADFLPYRDETRQQSYRDIKIWVT